MKIVIIISGSVAAYKSLDVIRELKRAGHSLQCVMSKDSEKFITPLSVSCLSGSKVHTDSDFFSSDFQHIRLLDEIDLIVVVPASAGMIAKSAHGTVDELASSLLLVNKIPIIMIPAMNTDMWLSAQVANNVKTLKLYGVKFMDPCHGTLACGVVGVGKLPEVRDIVSFINNGLKQL